MDKKKTIIYCSSIPPKVPPWAKFDFAQELAKTHKTIYIGLPGKIKPFKFFGLLFHFLWLLKLILKNPKIVTWDFRSPLSHLLLSMFLYIDKFIFRKKIILIINKPKGFYLYKFIPADLLIFDCSDQFHPREFKDNKNMIKKCDLVLANTQFMANILKKYNSKVKLIASGYSDNKLKIPNQSWPKINHSVIFIGGISRRIDYDLIYKTAQLMPDYNFFFAGEVYLNQYYANPKQDQHMLKLWQKLKALPNVFYLGGFSREKVVKLIRLFKVGIIPYNIKNKMNYFSHPIKVYEYLAAKLPIISTPIPALIEVTKEVDVEFSNIAHEWATLIRKNEKKSQLNLKQVKKLLKQQSKDRKAAQVMDAINFSFK